MTLFTMRNLNSKLMAQVNTTATKATSSTYINSAYADVAIVKSATGEVTFVKSAYANVTFVKSS